MVLIGTIDIPTYVYNLQNAEKCFCVNKVTKKELDFLLKNNISQFFIKSRTESARNLWPIRSHNIFTWRETLGRQLNQKPKIFSWSELLLAVILRHIFWRIDATTLSWIETLIHSNCVLLWLTIIWISSAFFATRTKNLSVFLACTFTILFLSLIQEIEFIHFTFSIEFIHIHLKFKVVIFPAG